MTMTSETAGMTTSLCNSAVRLPAEWEPQGAVLLSWPHENSDWNYILGDVQHCFEQIAKAIIPYAHIIIIAPDTSKAKAQLADLPKNRISYFDITTNDTWARDFGAITTICPDGTPVINDFRFNGWGMKFSAELDNAVTAAMVKAGLLRGKYMSEQDFVLEGGSIESDGHGTLLTTSRCLLSQNRNDSLNRQQIEARLSATLGFNRFLWLEDGELEGDDTDAHIDTLARFAPNDTIVYVGCDNIDDSHYSPLQKMRLQLESFRTAQGKPYNLIELPLPRPIYDPDDGHRLPATYANFLIINNAVIAPSYGQENNDKAAAQLLRTAYPGYEVITVDCRPLIRQHGSLHCVTMQLQKNALSI